jgi:hypothetical protein
MYHAKYTEAVHIRGSFSLEYAKTHRDTCRWPMVIKASCSGFFASFSLPGHIADRTTGFYTHYYTSKFCIGTTSWKRVLGGSRWEQ